MGFMSAFVKASAYALTKQPTVNAVIDGQEILYRDYVDVSVAVATPKVRHNTYLVHYDHMTFSPGSTPKYISISVCFVVVGIGCPCVEEC